MIGFGDSLLSPRPLRPFMQTGPRIARIVTPRNQGHTVIRPGLTCAFCVCLDDAYPRTLPPLAGVCHAVDLPVQSDSPCGLRNLV